MVFPNDILDRLDALGEDLASFEAMMRSEGEPFVRRYIARLEEAARLNHKWWPVLRDFVVKTRRDHPCPPEATLSPRDQAKIQIYETLIRKAERLPRRTANVVVFYILPLMAIPIARRLWPGEDDRGVFLTPEEIKAWRGIYSHPEDAFWWFMDYWWSIEDPPDSLHCDHGIDLSVPNGEPWLVKSGLCWGSLAGGEDIDLWSWDGEKATFVRPFCVTTY